MPKEHRKAALQCTSLLILAMGYWHFQRPTMGTLDRAFVLTWMAGMTAVLVATLWHWRKHSRDGGQELA